MDKVAFTDREFSGLFEQYSERINAISTRFSNSSEIPVDEFRSHLNEELWEAVVSFDDSKSATLNTWINKRLKQRAVEVTRSAEGGYYKRVGLFEEYAHEDEDENPGTVEVEDENEDVENRAIKKADQRQLIDFLTKHLDATTTAIVKAYSGFYSFREIGKSLGIDRRKVKRKLERLAKNHDPSQFGSYRDYLAV